MVWGEAPRAASEAAQRSAASLTVSPWSQGTPWSTEKDISDYYALANACVGGISVAHQPCRGSHLKWSLGGATLGTVQERRPMPAGRVLATMRICALGSLFLVGARFGHPWYTGPDCSSFEAP